MRFPGVPAEVGQTNPTVPLSVSLRLAEWILSPMSRDELIRKLSTPDVRRPPGSSSKGYLDDLLHRAEQWLQSDGDDGSYASNANDDWWTSKLRKGYEREDQLLGEDDEYAAQPGDTESIDDGPLHLKDTIDAAREALGSLHPGAIVDAFEDLLAAMDEIGIRVGRASDRVANWAYLLEQQRQNANDEDGDANLAAAIIAIRLLSERLCELIAADHRVLRLLDWRKVEEIVATALHGIGFRVELTPPSKDGGKDVVAYCNMQGREHVYFVEIKHWRSGKSVGATQVFNFVEITLAERADGGLFLSYSGFSEVLFQHVAQLSKHNVRLGAELKIVSLCQVYTRRRCGLWHPDTPLPTILFEGTLQ